MNFREAPESRIAGRRELLVIAETIEKALNAFRKPALASSGGRMGGSDFSSRSSGSSLLSSNSSLFRSDSSDYRYNSNRNNPEFNKEDFVLFLKFIGYFSAAFVAFVFLLAYFIVREDATVLKLQVGMLATTSSIQKDLNRIANDADTSTRAGFHYVLKETIQALLRDRDYCISGYSSANMQIEDEVEKCFKKVSNEERAKFDNETLVNVNNVKRKTKGRTTQDGIAVFQRIRSRR